MESVGAVGPTARINPPTAMVLVSDPKPGPTLSGVLRLFDIDIVGSCEDCKDSTADWGPARPPMARLTLPTTMVLTSEVKGSA